MPGAAAHSGLTQCRRPHYNDAALADKAAARPRIVPPYISSLPHGFPKYARLPVTIFNAPALADDAVTSLGLIR